MPKSGNQLGMEDEMKKLMDEAKEKKSVWRRPINYKGTKTCDVTDFMLDHYNEFWINVWVDRHLYKTIN